MELLIIVGGMKDKKQLGNVVSPNVAFKRPTDIIWEARREVDLGTNTSSLPEWFA